MARSFIRTCIEKGNSTASSAKREIYLNRVNARR